MEMDMEDQYSRQFFTMFVEGLQSSCKNFLKFNRFVEISGYISVEIDNVKKERYVLSELLQSSGNVVSESFCTKVLTISNSECNPQIPSNQTSLYQCQRQRNRRKPSRTFPSQRLERVSTCISQPVFPGVYGDPASESMVLPVSTASETVTMVTESSLSSPVVEQSNSESLGGRKRSASQSVFNISQFKLHRPVSSSSSKSYSEDPDEGNVIGLQHGTGTRPKEIQPLIQAESSRFPDYVGSHGHVSKFDSKSIEQNTDVKPIAVIRDVKPIVEIRDVKAIAEIQVSLPRTVSQADHDSGHQDIHIGARLEYQDWSGTGGDADEEIIDLDMSDGEVSQPSHSSFEKNICRDLNPVIGQSTFDSISMQTPPNTNPGSFGVMKSVVKRFMTYHKEKSGDSVDMVNTSPEELNALLLDFYQGAKKADGTELRGGSLRNIQVYLERYLKEADYPYSLVKDDEFLTSREYVRSKFVRIKGATKHVPIDDDDIEIMFKNNVLGGHSPDALFQTLWFMNSRYFARKKPGEHFNMKWGEISLKITDDGQEYLERPIYASFSLKLFANLDAPNRCFVKLYKQYRDMRPKLAMDGGCPFYLKQIKIPSKQCQDQWFLDQPMPWSPFTSVWKRMVISASLQLNKRIL